MIYCVDFSLFGIVRVITIIIVMYIMYGLAIIVMLNVGRIVIVNTDNMIIR